MRTCVDCGNPLVSGHPIEHNGPPRTTTYEFECGRCGRWWLEHKPLDPTKSRGERMAEKEMPKSLTYEQLRAAFDALNSEPEEGSFFWRGRYYTAPTFSQAVDLAVRDDPILSVLMGDHREGRDTAAVGV